MRGLTRRRLGVWPIAATIFFIVSGGPYTTEQIIGKSGPLCGLLILAILPLIWSLPVGLMTAELSSKFPEEGGYFVWVKTAFGPLAGFLCAWWSWTSSWVDLALYPLIAVQYAARLGLPITHPYLFVVAIVLVLTAWNLLGIGKVGKLSYTILILVTMPFIILTGIGISKWISHPPAVPFLNPNVGLGGIGAATVLGLWNYFGWDSITTTLGEVDDAAKKFPKAIFLAILLVSAAVILPVAAGIALKTDWPHWDSDNGYWPEIATAAWPPLRSIIVIGGVVSNIGLFNANLLASSRIPFVLAAENYLPKFLLHKHPKYKTPWVGIVIGGIISILLAQESFEKLVSVDLSLYLLALMFECTALVSLRKKIGTSHSNFEVGGGKFGLALCAGFPVLIGVSAICLQLSPTTRPSESIAHPVLILTGLVVAGPLVFGVAKFASKRKRSRTH